MTTLEIVPKKTRPEPSAEELAANELVRAAREQGLSMTGPDGLLRQFTKSVLEAALNEEMTEHLGHEKHRAPDDRDSTNIRNGTRAKTVLTEATGHVEIDVPRDRDGTFEPQIVKKLQRRLTGVDEIVSSLHAKGLTVAIPQKTAQSRAAKSDGFLRANYRPAGRPSRPDTHRSRPRSPGPHIQTGVGDPTGLAGVSSLRRRGFRPTALASVSPNQAARPTSCEHGKES